tara:strand:- start:509 stop:808 length:300 start_codon:yes stop_codon:yes gene_type:complete
MTHFNVTNVVDGDTFDVNPEWEWKGNQGQRIRPKGFNTPERWEAGYSQAKKKLKELIHHKNVELKNAVKIDRGRLVCDVFLNGRNLANYFPKYKLSKSF